MLSNSDYSSATKHYIVEYEQIVIVRQYATKHKVLSIDG
jgi:hypothetical protein